MATPIKAKCSKEFRAVHDSGTRTLAELRWVVLHSEEANTARSAAAWFANPNSKGSAHLCVDGKECYRTLPDSTIPWAARGANHRGLHIEMAGYAAWKWVTWRKHWRLLHRAAYKVAVWCKKYDIPPYYIGPKGLQERKRGVTTHAACTKAFGGDHTDPGKFFPRRFFMRLVRKYYAELD